MKNLTVILSLENKKNGLEKVWKKSWILSTKILRTLYIVWEYPPAKTRVFVCPKEACLKIRIRKKQSCAVSVRHFQNFRVCYELIIAIKTLTFPRISYRHLPLLYGAFYLRGWSRCSRSSVAVYQVLNYLGHEQNYLCVEGNLKIIVDKGRKTLKR